MADPVSKNQLRRRVVLLGATGSIGGSALRVIARHPDRLELVGIASRGNWRELARIAREHRVPHVGIFDPVAAAEARASGALPAGTRVHEGIKGLCELAALSEADVVLLAVVGTTGLRPALAAIAAGKTLALASKEVLVLGGSLVMAAAASARVRVLPVDSEHNAVFQCLEGHARDSVQRVILTASGGAFRDWPQERLAQATPEDALRHPNWSMGPKVTVDSATLANKGLELIEAQWLFSLRPEQLAAVIHPQSIVHSLVEFRDGALLAHLSPPSMTFPIQHALLYPERAPGTDAPLPLDRLFSLDFRPVDEQRFPMLRLALGSLRAGGLAAGIYNAANEVAVEAFLARKLPFLAIAPLVEATLAKLGSPAASSLDETLHWDLEARRVAQALMPAHL
ncbi:1-deoxy-D-xylulose-5-phosphate reductoisomerase [Nibricoccus sp. IMCC34717]|uniref:1-deoxy-D-xylulose-5-phosphate reductoisomerase n=1 Tax=Nibricoccus sp. IMCC34717 TaxID=3034021 RepID=UPI00384C0682